MCGIAGYFVKDGLPFAQNAAEKLVDELFRGIASRGRDACGFVAIGEEGTLEWQKAAVAPEMFIRKRRAIPENTRTCLIHTRWSTQGHHGFMENNHPLKRGPFYVVHNGHIHNDDDLFEVAQRERYGEVDSESIVALLSHLGDLGAVPLVMQELEGAAACAFIDERMPNRLMLAKQGNPLHFIETNRLVVFASTDTAVRNAYRDAFSLKQAQANELIVRFMADGDWCSWTNGEYDKGEFEVKSYSKPNKNSKKTDPYENYGYGGYYGGVGTETGQRQLGPGQPSRDGSASRSGNITSKDADACSVPDDGRPEKTKLVHPLTRPVNNEWDYTPAKLICELCQQDKGPRSPFSTTYGGKLMLCDTCLEWAQKQEDPNVVEEVADLTADLVADSSLVDAVVKGWDPSNDEDHGFGFNVRNIRGGNGTKKESRNRNRKARRN